MFHFRYLRKEPAASRTVRPPPFVSSPSAVGSSEGNQAALRPDAVLSLCRRSLRFKSSSWGSGLLRTEPSEFGGERWQTPSERERVGAVENEVK